MLLKRDAEVCWDVLGVLGCTWGCWDVLGGIGMSLTQVGCKASATQYGPTCAPRKAGISTLRPQWSIQLEHFERIGPLWFIAFEGVIALALSWPFEGACYIL